MSVPTETVTVAADDGDIRLDRWVKRHRPATPHALLSRWAREGRVTLDGVAAGPATRIKAGQVLSIPVAPPTDASPRARPRKPVSAEDAAFAQSMVLHRDAQALVIAKPPGLATQGGTRTDRHVDGLLDALAFDLDARPKLVHRLDKDTSGALLLARTGRAAAFFAKTFSSRTARKTYWALVMGVPSIDQGEINLPLAKQPGTGGEKMMVAPDDGQAAKTRYRVIARAGNRASWVELQPLTGRTHQLRVHMAAIGHPIVGDGKYGGKESFLTGTISRKMHLHARRIRVDHPDGGAVDVTAPLPPHFAESLADLGFEEADGDAYVDVPDKAPPPADAAKRAAKAHSKDVRKARRGERRGRAKPAAPPRGKGAGKGSAKPAAKGTAKGSGKSPGKATPKPGGRGTGPGKGGAPRPGGAAPRSRALRSPR